jgi:cell division protein FtsB
MRDIKENTNQNEFLQKFTESRVGSILFLGLSVILLYNVVKSIVIISEKLEILNHAEKEVGDLRLDNLELLTLSEYMKSDEYLETEARNRLNLSGKGETVFVIPEEILKKGISDVEEILEKDEGNENIENIEIWKDFFLNGI